MLFKNLYEKQIEARDEFCTDLEECCAASNDFIRMSEKCEEIVEEITNLYDGEVTYGRDLAIFEW